LTKEKKERPPAMKTEQTYSNLYDIAAAYTYDYDNSVDKI
jgi:hypothetical protein